MVHKAVGILVCAAVFGIAAYLRDLAAILPVAICLAIFLPKTKSVTTACALSCAFLGLFYAVSTAKKAVIGQPLMGFDVRFLGEELLMLAANDWRVLGGFVLVGVVIAVAAFAYAVTPFRPLSVAHVILLGAISSLAGLVATAILASPEARGQIDRGPPTVLVFAQTITIGSYRLTPAPVPDEPVAATAEEPAAPSSVTVNAPHIVFILQESTVSPVQIDAPGTRVPQHLFVNGTGSHTAPLRVTTFGGGSWLNEFALMAQFRADQLGPHRDYVFFTMEDRMKRSIFTVLTARGYESAVVYSGTADYMNAGPFYMSAGVQRFYDPAAAGIGDGWNWQLPDAVFLDFALGLLGREAPQVILVETVAQHGPHDLSDPMADYQDRFADSDAAHGAFVRAAAEASHRPVVIVTFGDHLPLFMDTFVTPADRHLTSYQIECTQPSLCDFSRLPERMDIALLASALFDVIGFERDALMRAQAALLQDCADDIGACTEATLARYNWHVAREALRP